MIRDARRFARHPDTVVLLSLLLFLATATTLTGNVSPAVQKVAPIWLGLVWSGTFALACGIALAGVLWRDPIVGWLMELVGRVTLAITSFGFTFALVAGMSSPGALVAIGFVAAICVSSVVRVKQIVKRLHEFRGALIARKT